MQRARDWVLVAAIASVGVFASPGCDGSGESSATPDEAFRTFLMHWFKDERERAFEMIDPRDRDLLTRPLSELEESLESEDLPAPSDMLVAGRVDNPYDLASIEVAGDLPEDPTSGDGAELTLTYQDGRTAGASTVFRRGQWYVDLPTGSREKGGGANGDGRGEPDR